MPPRRHCRQSRACSSSGGIETLTVKLVSLFPGTTQQPARRGGRADGGPDPEARVGLAEKLLAFILVLVGIMSSVASDAGYLILVPLGAAAFLSIGRHPLAGLAACFAAVGSVFGVNPILGPDRRDDHRDHERGPGRTGAAPLTIVANWFFSIGSSLVLAVVVALITERMIEPRLGKYTGSVVAGADEEPEVDAAAESKGLRYAALALPRVRDPRARAHAPAGRPAARPGDRRHHRHDAVHGQPAVHHRDGVPGLGHRLRAGRGDVQERERRHRGGDEDVRRPRRARLHAADDQPVHRLLQLQQPAQRARDRARGVAGERRASGRCHC